MRPIAPRVVSCHGKEPLSAIRAQEVAADMRRRHHDGAINAYHCRHCHRWHVGSTHLPKSERDS